MKKLGRQVEKNPRGRRNVHELFSSLACWMDTAHHPLIEAAFRLISRRRRRHRRRWRFIMHQKRSKLENYLYCLLLSTAQTQV